MTNIPGVNSITERGIAIYKELIAQNKIDPEKERGKYLVINTNNKDVLLGENLEEILQDFRKKYPIEIFYTVKVGYEGVFSVSGYLESYDSV